MNKGWRDHILPLAAIMISMVVTALALPHLPDPVPIHWGPTGQPDNHAPRLIGAFLLPLTALGVYLLFLVIPSLDPRKKNYEKFADTYHFWRIGFVLFMVFLQGVTLYSILVEGGRLNTDLVFIGVGLLFILIGNYMPRVRSNWFVGIRNPWTLSNQDVWRRTHRFGGQIFVGGGMVMMAVALLPPDWQVVVLLGAIIMMAMIPNVYSYVLFRRIHGGNEAELGEA